MYLPSSSLKVIKAACSGGIVITSSTGPPHFSKYSSSSILLLLASAGRSSTRTHVLLSSARALRLFFLNFSCVLLSSRNFPAAVRSNILQNVPDTFNQVTKATVCTSKVLKLSFNDSDGKLDSCSQNSAFVQLVSINQLKKNHQVFYVTT